MLLKALKTVFMCNMTALCSQWACVCLFKLTQHPENLNKSSKSSWTKYPGEEGRLSQAIEYFSQWENMQSLHLINACVGHVTASARLCRYNTDLRHCGGGLTVTHKRAVDLTIKDANSCHCPDPFQLLPSDTFSPDVGCVQIQSCPVFLSLCPCSVGVGLGLFFWGSCLSSHRVQVLDSTQKTRP